MRGADTSEPCQDLEDKRDLGAPSPAVSADNQWKDKRVESPSWLCLDGGSTPPISTDRKRPSSYAGGLFLSVEIRACGAGASPSQPQSASLTALSGARGLRLRLRPVAPLLQLPVGRLAPAPPRRLTAPSGCALKMAYLFCTPFFREISDSNLSESVWS